MGNIAKEVEKEEDIKKTHNGGEYMDLEGSFSPLSSSVPTYMGENTEKVELEETIKTTARFLKLHRRAKWEKKMGWDPNDKSRIINSKEVNPEDLQDFTSPMVLVGTDVESLYPNLKVEAVSKRMKEAILESGMKWEDIDYMEAARYIAVSGEQCKVKNNAE